MTIKRLESEICKSKSLTITSTSIQNSGALSVRSFSGHLAESAAPYARLRGRQDFMSITGDAVAVIRGTY
jgi:hypothetical protein